MEPLHDKPATFLEQLKFEELTQIESNYISMADLGNELELCMAEVKIKANAWLLSSNIKDKENLLQAMLDLSEKIKSIRSIIERYRRLKAKQPS